MLDPRVDFGIDGPEYGSLERPSASHAPVRAHQHNVLAPQDRGECSTLFPVANEHVGGPELLANIEHRHALPEKGRVVEHRFERHADQTERDHRW